MRGKEQRHPKQLQSLAGLGDQDLGVSKDWGGREKCNMVYSVTATGPGCPLAVRKVQRDFTSQLFYPPVPTTSTRCSGLCGRGGGSRGAGRVRVACPELVLEEVPRSGETARIQSLGDWVWV